MRCEILLVEKLAHGVYKDLDKLFDELQRTFAQTNDFWKSERSEQAKPEAAKGN